MSTSNLQHKTQKKSFSCNQNRIILLSLGVLLVSTLISAAPDITKRDTEQSPSAFSNIYSAISDAGRYSVNALMGTPTQDDASRSARTSRQVNTDKVVVPGFPNGLPSGTPEGVKLALASAVRGPDGEFIMNPIPGQAGIDFPVLATVPDTGFDCGAQQFPGIYGDVDADCQVFYMCQPNGNYDAFLCPNGTIFNQQYFICDWWYNMDCAASPNFYPLNEFIYQDQDEEDA